MYLIVLFPQTSLHMFALQLGVLLFFAGHTFLLCDV